MARLLQQNCPERRLVDRVSACAGALFAVAIAATTFLAGCLLTPPIEPRDEPNLSPRIRPLSPDEKSAVIEVGRDDLVDDEIRLSAELYDGNDEPELHYLFLSDQQNILHGPSRTGGSLGEVGGEFHFGTFGVTYKPCGEVEVPGTEVVTLYVSDRGFQSSSPDPSEIVEVEGALMVAYSWVLKYEAGLCD